MRRSNARSPAVNPTPSPAAGNPPMDRPQIRASSQSATFPHRYSLLSKVSSKQAKGGFWISVSAAATAAAVLCLFLVTTRYGQKRFGIVIDGGSTGTRIHVYAYVASGGVSPLIDLGSSRAMRVTPGLSSFAGNPDAAGGSLLELLEFGRRGVPKDLWGVTEIRLMATAGLRLLDDGVQQKILDSCRNVLRSSGFRFRDEWATVITGSDEGVYAWITANYALGSLGIDPQETTGIIELGGASAQVTFVSTEPLPPEYSRVLKFGKTTYNIYSHSFLNFGQNVAFESMHKLYRMRNRESSTQFVSKGVVSDPCTPRGYSKDKRSDRLSVIGLPSDGYIPGVPTSGNFSECRSAALSLLQEGKESCLYDHCRVGSVFVPELQGKFVATENFFYTSKFFRLGSTPSLSDIVRAGQQYCGAGWSKLRKKYSHLDEDALLHYCFSSAYIIALLHDSLGIALDDKRIRFTNEVGDIPLDWALGAFIMHRTSDVDGEARSSWMSNVIRSDSSGLLSILVIFSVFIFAVWSACKWRTPQMKTIYDLEKGRYIITRVSP